MQRSLSPSALNAYTTVLRSRKYSRASSAVDVPSPLKYLVVQPPPSALPAARQFS